MKLIDDTVNPVIGGENVPKFIVMSVFMNNSKSCPTLCNMGDIIRVHRAQIRRHGYNFTLNCDCDIQASWAIFHFSESDYPTRHLGSTFTFTPDDKTRLNSLRNFSNVFFAKSFAYDCSISINLKKDEIDTYAIVLSREDAFPQDMITMFTNEKFIKFQVNKNRFTNIKPRDIVHIRGLKKIKGFYVVEDYTGILCIPDSYMIALTFRKKYFELAKTNFEIRKTILNYLPLESESGDISFITASKVLDDSLSFISLNSLFSIPKRSEKGKKYRAKVFVLEIIPRDPNKWMLKTSNLK